MKGVIIIIHQVGKQLKLFSMKQIIKKLIGIFFPIGEVLPPGETELDYMPPPKSKRKYSKKREFPIEPHSKTVKASLKRKVK